MKRFPLELPLELHTEFLRTFPGYGVRSTLLRMCIKRLIEQARHIDSVINEVVSDALECYKRKEGER